MRQEEICAYQHWEVKSPPQVARLFSPAHDTEHVSSNPVPPMIQAEHLCKSFGKIRAIQDLSFAVGSGEILGLLGPNGAGKTTTMRILAGFFPPTSGRVSVNGADLFDFRRAVKRQIGYPPENVPLYQNLTAESFLGYVADVKGVPYRQKKKSIRHVIEQCNLGAVERRLIGGLSRGFRQRLGLAQALLGSPSVLILDEPTVGLDPKQITEIRSLIKTLAKERVVIISTHILPEASMLCSRVLIIHKGILVASGAPDELGYQLRRSGELMVHVRGSQELIEESFR